jgi:rod shape determining protein RodA
MDAHGVCGIVTIRQCYFIPYHADFVAFKVIPYRISHFFIYINNSVSIIMVASVSMAAVLMNVAALIGVLCFGSTGHGAKRWLTFFNVTFQPSELCKITVPWVTAYCLTLKETMYNTFKLVATHCWLAILCILVPFILIAKQPDLGTALVVLASGLSVLFISGTARHMWLMCGIMGMVWMPLGWTHLHDYQKQRLTIFLNPSSDPMGNGYQILQSKIAIGSGGLLGHPLPQTTQAYLKFLPEYFNDLIFSASAEWWGLLGSVCLVLLYTWITLNGLHLAIRHQNVMQTLSIGGWSITFGLSAFVNISMACGLLPIVGVPLPLMSFGGTSLLVWSLMLGLIWVFSKDA